MVFENFNFELSKIGSTIRWKPNKRDVRKCSLEKGFDFILKLFFFDNSDLLCFEIICPFLSQFKYLQIRAFDVVCYYGLAFTTTNYITLTHERDVTYFSQV